MPYGLHSCVDGDLHLHSRDAGSEDWLVEAIWPNQDEYEVCPLIENWATYNVTTPQNAWYVDGCAAFRITTKEGRVIERTVGTYPEIRSGYWAGPLNSAPPQPTNLRPWGVILPSRD